jgi:competence ComEA-like helix-hairpin-helix protein
VSSGIHHTTRRLLTGALAVGVLLSLAGPALAKGEEAASASVSRVELNTASVRELCTLPGIGLKKAEAIVAFRERRPFTRVTQLMLVKGIGRRTLERLRPLVFVAPLDLGGSADRDGRVHRRL